MHLRLPHQALKLCCSYTPLGTIARVALKEGLGQLFCQHLWMYCGPLHMQGWCAFSEDCVS